MVLMVRFVDAWAAKGESQHPGERRKSGTDHLTDIKIYTYPRENPIVHWLAFGQAWRLPGLGGGYKTGVTWCSFSFQLSLGLQEDTTKQRRDKKRLLQHEAFFNPALFQGAESSIHSSLSLHVMLTNNPVKLSRLGCEKKTPGFMVSRDLNLGHPTPSPTFHYTTPNLFLWF